MDWWEGLFDYEDGGLRIVHVSISSFRLHTGRIIRLIDTLAPRLRRWALRVPLKRLNYFKRIELGRSSALLVVSSCRSVVGAGLGAVAAGRGGEVVVEGLFNVLVAWVARQLVVGVVCVSVVVE